MTEFHFLRPYWLLAFLPLCLLIWRTLSRSGRGGGWADLCDPALRPHVLVSGPIAGTARMPILLLGLGGSLAIAALAGPVWERLPAPVFRDAQALVIALDLSRSMDAADLKPSRLERARYKVADILSQRKGGLTALVVYSGDAFTVTPLTDDGQTINAQLSALATDLMPAQGSRADLALDLAERLLKQAGVTRGDVLLITSGVNLTRGEPAAQRLAAEGYRVSVLGAGGEEGAPIPLPQGGFLEDTHGNIVISKLAGPALQQLAQSGGGRYRTLTADNADLSALLAFFSRPEHGNGDAESQARMDLWLERGPWLLPFLLPIAALAFRRGYLAALLCFFLAPVPDAAQAFEWQDLWRTPDQQAEQALDAGDAAAAAAKFHRPDWKAAAQYKAGEFENAAKTLDGQETPDAQYNRGNALARSGRLQEAVKAYESELARNPGHEDARYNKELVEKALEEQKKQQDQQNQGQGGSGQDKNEQSKDQQSSGSDQGEKQQDQSSQSQAGEQGQDESRNQQGQRPQPEESGQEPRQSDEPQTGEARKQDRQELQEPESRGEGQMRPSEEQQASEQWLRRIPDDPGGLLKRKFYYQYQQRQGQNRGRQP